MRPWTYIATEKQTGSRVSDHFHAGHDASQAALEFKSKHPDKQLEALLPGAHPCVTFETKLQGRKLFSLGD
jgi:hypothetical protein